MGSNSATNAAAQALGAEGRIVRRRHPYTAHGQRHLFRLAQHVIRELARGQRSGQCSRGEHAVQIVDINHRRRAQQVAGNLLAPLLIRSGFGVGVSPSAGNNRASASRPLRLPIVGASIKCSGVGPAISSRTNGSRNSATAGARSGSLTNGKSISRSSSDGPPTAANCAPAAYQART
jgi:hypothetical protein